MLAWEPDKLRGERTKRDKVIGKKTQLPVTADGLPVIFREIDFTKKKLLTCHNIEISILALIIRMRRLFTRMFVVGPLLNFRVLCVESSI